MKAPPPTLALTLSTAILAGGMLVSCDNRQAVHDLDFSWGRMLVQPRANAYGATLAFEDHRVMRTPPEGTLRSDRPSEASVDAALVKPKLTRALLERGRARFNIFCAACHGIPGNGVSVVASKMELRRPPSLHEARIVALSDEYLYDVVAQGYGLMNSYAAELSVEDRWAVIAYVRALQLSQSIHVSDLSPPVRAELFQEAR